MRDTSILFATSQPIKLTGRTDGFRRRLLDLPCSAHKQFKHDDIVDALSLGLLYANKKVVTIKKVK